MKGEAYARGHCRARKARIEFENGPEQGPNFEDNPMEMERKGLFPQRIQISENRVGWIEEDVTAWIETKKGA